jgi:hypothetical protein
MRYPPRVLHALVVAALYDNLPACVLLRSVLFRDFWSYGHSVPIIFRLIPTAPVPLAAKLAALQPKTY